MLNWNILFGNIAWMMAVSFRLPKIPLLSLALHSSIRPSFYLREANHPVDLLVHFILFLRFFFLSFIFFGFFFVIFLVLDHLYIRWFLGHPWIIFLGQKVLGHMPLFATFKAASFISMFLLVLCSFCLLKGVHINGGVISIWMSGGIMRALLVGVGGLVFWGGNGFLNFQLGVCHFPSPKIGFSLSIALDSD